MSSDMVARYLERIGMSGPVEADAESLRLLQWQHLRAVPFENLSIHLGEPIQLREALLVDQVVTRHRGGFCYELNGAFAWLLRQLGFEVSLLSARVYAGQKLGVPFDHMALRVDLDEPWLVDVGFGRFTQYPLRLDERGEQPDPGGTFTLTAAKHGDLDVHCGRSPEYRLELRPRDLEEFDATCWYQQTSPKSHFTQSTTCSRPTDTGRITLSGKKLITTTAGQRTEQILESEAEILAAYQEHFGMRLDRVPAVKAQETQQ